MAKLMIVGTPIGNLGDLTPRAAEALRQADFIAAEDTRVTVKLLNHLGIKKPMLSYHEHNRRQCGEKILARLLAGESCALVSDAGMPCISDPGEDLVRLCGEQGIETVVMPGPSAAVSALALSGLPAGRFTFEGFLSVQKGSRRRHLEEIAAESRTMIFYEAPHKLPATLADLCAALGEDRPIALARELTKLHEEVIRTTLGEARRRYEAETPKGEFVLVIQGAAPAQEAQLPFSEALDLVLRRREEGLSLSQAAKEISHLSGYPKAALYKAALGEGEPKGNAD